MNHDATHCIACDSECPKDCYRAQLTRELKNITPCYPFPVSWSNFEGTEECKRGKKMNKTIKGRYVALVEIDVHVEETGDVRPIEEIKEDMVDGPLTEALQKRIDAMFGKDADVTVTQQYADVYEVEDEH